MKRHGSCRVESRAAAAGGVGEKNCGLAAFMPRFIYTSNALRGNLFSIALHISNHSQNTLFLFHTSTYFDSGPR
jgi:hypothetical protein